MIRVSVENASFTTSQLIFVTTTLKQGLSTLAHVVSSLKTAAPPALASRSFSDEIAWSKVDNSVLTSSSRKLLVVVVKLAFSNIGEKSIKERRLK